MTTTSGDTPSKNTVLSKWYYEGAPPVWAVQCWKCERVYYIIPDIQGFKCDCRANEIWATENDKTE